MPEIKIVTISEIIFYNKDNGYTVAVAQNDSEEFTAVGYLPDFTKGRSYKLTGSFKSHPTYGEQFVFTEHEEILPTSKEGIEGFLSSGLLKGIGKKTAAIIVNKFGEDTFRVIEEEPERLTEVSGIGNVKAEAICEAFRSHKEFAEITLYLQQYGITSDYAMKLYKVYGSNTISVIEDNPYQLVKDVFGIGFRKADSIALKLGVEKNSEERIESGVTYTIWYYISEGHTFVPKKELCEKTGGLLDVAIEEIDDVLTDMAFTGQIHIETLENRPVVFLMSYFMAEQNVAKKLIAINEAPLKIVNSDVRGLIKRTEADTDMELSENQKYAIITSLTHGVSVITGGPGTGKTTIINAIINVLNQGGHKTAIAAPTGRAAKRITETSGHFASTIHRLLEYYYSEGEDSMRFGKTEEDPLDYEAIILDEASMIDLMLMNGLVNAIKPGTRLIMVGDADQLPSVGAGNILSDIIKSEYIYCVKLTEIFRQARESLIVVNAHKINKGEYPYYNEKDKDFFLVRRNGEKEMLLTIKDLLVRRLPDYYKECVPIKDIQVLTPVRKGLIGSINLNKELQEVLNPASEEKEERKFGEKIFREGDKVMQIRNNYQMKWKKLSDFTEGDGVFNGDVGFVETIDKEFNQMTVVYDEDKYVTYEFSDLDEVELAYAVTVHKSQGSEFPIVVMPVSWFPPMLATRNLLYTAVTRGKTAVVLVGSENKMEAMVDNNRITNRYSGLWAKLGRAGLEKEIMTL